jgi:glycosyltransferase involved in cell wall biosynthesis
VKLVNQPSRGVTSAVNTAYENSRSELTALLDADGAFEPAKLELVVQTFRENPVTRKLGERAIPSRHCQSLRLRRGAGRWCRERVAQ